MRVRWCALHALVSAGLLAICACAGSESHDDASTLVTIVATDSGYVVPDTLHEGLNHIAFENHGSMIHECMFIRLSDGVTASNYIAAVDSGYDFPEGAYDCSGAGLLSPGERVELWIPLEPGQYFLGCWFADHIGRKPPRTIVVHGSPRVPVTPPREDATLKLVDFRFELSNPIRRGTQTIRVETVGPSMHEMDCYRLDGGRSLKDLQAWFTNHKEGSPFATSMGGVLDTHDLSRVVWYRRDFTVGRYVFWCDMPMIQKGIVTGAAAHATHAQAGMVLEFDVSM